MTLIMYGMVIYIYIYYLGINESLGLDSENNIANP